MPKLCLYFPAQFEDPAWAGSSFCLDVPSGDHGHGKPGEWVLGRHPAADVTLAPRSISQRHCAISYSYAANQWTITDLGSTNKTYLNGKQISPGDPALLAVGDKLHLGPNPINIVEHEHDTVEQDHDATTVAGTQPLDHRTGLALDTDPPPLPKTWSDTLYLGMSWVIAPTSKTGMLYRLLVLAIAACVVVLIMGWES